MRVAHLLHVLDELDGEVVIGVELSALSREGVARAWIGAICPGFALGFVAMALPRPEMHFVDVQRAMHVVSIGALAHPGAVFPSVTVDIPEPGCGAGGLFGIKRIGIRFIEQIAIFRLNDVFI